jgi:hypothetical protein
LRREAQSDNEGVYGVCKWLFLLQDLGDGRCDTIHNPEFWCPQSRRWFRLPTKLRVRDCLRKSPARCGSLADRVHYEMRSAASDLTLLSSAGI